MRENHTFLSYWKITEKRKLGIYGRILERKYGIEINDAEFEVVGWSA